MEKLHTPESSLIDCLIYDKSKQLLKVIYKNGKHQGKLRKYKDFPEESFNIITRAVSKGQSLLMELKRYKSEKKTLLNTLKKLF